MSNNEKLEILRDVATFAMNAVENGVEMSYEYISMMNQVSFLIWDKGKIIDHAKIRLDQNTNLELREFMIQTVNKYYHV